MQKRKYIIANCPDSFRARRGYESRILDFVVPTLVGDKIGRKQNL